jgi:hypothetical protein
MPITHAFVSGIADDPAAVAAGEVLPSHWNAAHILTGVKSVLSANTTYHVATSGSDSTGDGSAGKPWATIQHAIFYLSGNIDGGGNFITLSVGAGTFVGAGMAPITGIAGLFIYGAGSGSTTINNGPNDGVYNQGECISCLYDIPMLAINAVNLTNSLTNTDIVSMEAGQLLALGDWINYTSDIIFTQSGTNSGGVSLYAEVTVELIPGLYTFNVTVANTNWFFASQSQAATFRGFVSTINVTVTGTFSFTYGFVLLNDFSSFDVRDSGMSINWSGATPTGFSYTMIGGGAWFGGATFPAPLTPQILLGTSFVEGQVQIPAGGKVFYGGSQIIQAQISLNNYYEGGAGNLTGTGDHNLATGSGALAAVTSGKNNTAVGAGALGSLTSGDHNFGFGALSLNSLDVGQFNVALGVGAMQFSTGAGCHDNLAIGAVTMANCTGNTNTAIGSSALNSITSGSNNIGIGSLAGKSITTHNNNIAIGSGNMPNADAASNICIGANTGANLTSGDSNCFVGVFAGFGITTGRGNAILGGAGNLVTLAAGLTNNAIISDGDGHVFLTQNSGGTFTNTGATFILRTQVSLINNAAAQAGTLTNAPSAGNPSKWVAYDDNGTTRYIPMW